MEGSSDQGLFVDFLVGLEYAGPCLEMLNLLVPLKALDEYLLNIVRILNKDASSSTSMLFYCIFQTREKSSRIDAAHNEHGCDLIR